jgi:aminoglycoside phosphotransferase (APT) family kinase protein
MTSIGRVAPVETEFEQAILSALGATPPGGGPRVTFERRVSHRHSELIVLRVEPRDGRGGETVCVKRLTDWNPAKPRGMHVQREFEILQHVASTLPPRLAASFPRAVAVLPEHGAIIASYLPGVPLSRVLQRHANRITGPWQHQRCRALGNEIGRWLRDFQAATRQAPATFDREAFLRHFGTRCQRVGSRLPSSAVESFLDLASNLTSALQGTTVPRAARHGDFIPQNILVSGTSQIGLVDVESFSLEGSAYPDPAMLLAYVLLLERSAGYSSGAIRRFRDGFLAAAASGLDPKLLAAHAAGAVMDTANHFTCGCDTPTCGHRRRFASRVMWVRDRLVDIAGQRGQGGSFGGD